MTAFRRLLCTFATAALVGTVGVAIPTVRADPVDDRFLAALRSQGITFRSPEAAIAVGHLVCTRLDQGADTIQVGQELMASTELDGFHAGFFVGASVKAYCPQYGVT